LVYKKNDFQKQSGIDIVDNKDFFISTKALSK